LRLSLSYARQLANSKGKLFSEIPYPYLGINHGMHQHHPMIFFEESEALFLASPISNSAKLYKTSRAD
jgi:hypothetical protein